MTTQTLTLTDFLLARIAEDEARADETHNIVDDDVLDLRAFGTCACGQPARVLAECEAKRRIVEDFEILHADYQTTHDPSTEIRRFQARLAMARVASIYADHADYRPEWRP